MGLYDDLRVAANAQQDRQQQYGYCLRVCMAAGCVSQHSDSIKTALEDELKTRGLDELVQVKGVGCMGLCAAGPLVLLEPVSENSIGPPP